MPRAGADVDVDDAATGEDVDAAGLRPPYQGRLLRLQGLPQEEEEAS